MFVIVVLNFRYSLSTKSRCEEKKNLLTVKILPKKPTRALEKTLVHLYEKIHLNWADKGRRDVSDADPAMDRDFKIKQKEVVEANEWNTELAIYGKYILK